MMILLSLLLTAQDAAAEAAYKEMVSRIQKAESISVACTSEATMKTKASERKIKISGALEIKVGLRARVDLVHTENGRPRTFSILSDGKNSRRYSPMVEPPFATPPTVRDFLDGMLLRTGLAHTYLSTGSFLGFWTEWGDRVSSLFDFQASELRSGENDGKAHTLTYRVIAIARQTGERVKASGAIGATEAPGTAVSVRLWYDPVTFLPLKRTVRWTDKDGAETLFTETYDKFILGADIPDERFRLTKD